MKKLPYYRLWVKDFETDENVRVLDFSELGLYLSCLNHSWINEGLPINPEDIQRSMKATAAQFKKLWPRVSKCFQEKDGRLINPRQEAEREKACSKSIQSSEAVAQRERNRHAAIIGRSSDDHPYARTRADSVYDSVVSSEILKLEKETMSRAQEKKPGPVSTSFANFWARWCELTKRRQRESYACQAWISVVEVETEAAAMECLERYGLSGDVQRGAIASPDKWIYDQARDAWRGDWPGAHMNGNSKASDLEKYLNEH